MKDKGITLIALVITIIVLLILVGVTVMTLTGDNGLLEKTGEVKEATEIGEEKEIIALSVTQARAKNMGENFTQDELQEALNQNSKENNKAFIIDSNEEIVIIKFDSDRYYEVDYNGNISEAIRREEIDYAGDITKNGTCKGTEEEPFQINCIEDLISFSQNVKNGNTYEGQNIKLIRTLDFNSISSYNDYKTKEYDSYLGGDGSTELKTQLSNKGKGFMPIENFKGIFDGNNLTIKNIYINEECETINYSKYCGLFRKIIRGGIVKNLTLGKGKINGINVAATGGICGFNEGKIINCINLSDVNSNVSAGGISGNGRRRI